MRPQDYYLEGNLKEAIVAAKDEVRKHPTEAAKRGFLCELLCFAGDLEGADRQLDALSNQDPEATLGVALFRHLIRAEQARQQFYSEGRLPEFLGLPSDRLRLHLEASIQLREGKGAEATALLAQAEAQRPKVTGTCNDKPFDDLRDGDDLTASFFEVLTSTGKYYWVPMEQVDLIEFRPPARPRDLIWQRAHMIVHDGPDGEVYLPTLYAGSHTDPDEKVRLGRVTGWKGGDAAPVPGAGLRTFLVGSEGHTILELQTIAVNRS